MAWFDGIVVVVVWCGLVRSGLVRWGVVESNGEAMRW